MNYAFALLSPFALLLPAAGTVETKSEDSETTITSPQEAPTAPDEETNGGQSVTGDSVIRSFQDWPFSFVSQSFRVESSYQVRIEQQMTIRVAPRRAPVRQNMFMGLPNRAIGPDFAERKIGNCLPVGGIAGVQTNGGSDLILYMRDERVISARLERACRARDFYSGFYLSRSDDGRLCVNRDTLQSRSGANCKLTRIRQIVQSGN